MTITHENTSTLNIPQMYDKIKNITSTLTSYILGEYIESTIVLTAVKEITSVECIIGVFESGTLQLSDNSLGEPFLVRSIHMYKLACLIVSYRQRCIGLIDSHAQPVYMHVKL